MLFIMHEHVHEGRVCFCGSVRPGPSLWTEVLVLPGEGLYQLVGGDTTSSSHKRETEKQH